MLNTDTRTYFAEGLASHNCVEEAWVVIWPEHLGPAEFLAGVNLTAFAADYAALPASRSRRLSRCRPPTAGARAGH